MLAVSWSDARPSSRGAGVRSRNAEGDVVKPLHGFLLNVEVQGGAAGGGVNIAVDRAGLSEGKGQRRPARSARVALP